MVFASFRAPKAPLSFEAGVLGDPVVAFRAPEPGQSKSPSLYHPPGVSHAEAEEPRESGQAERDADGAGSADGLGVGVHDGLL